MQLIWRILAVQALSAIAAKTSRRLPLEATEPSSDGSEREFTVFDKKTCVGTPYTKNLEASCVGWEGLTAEECELKCASNEKAPNCPKETCHAAVFYPASGGCHLFHDCKQFQASIGSETMIDQEMLKQEQETEQRQVIQLGKSTDLVTAMPIVLLNLTNISTLLRNGHHSPGIVHAFGDITADREMLLDKVHGFFLVLREKMTAESGQSYCPFGSEAVISECITIAQCILQRAVPTEVDMETFASITEQVARFEEITWPLLKGALIQEGDEDEDKTIPAELRCDGLEEADPHALAAPAFLQREARASEGSVHAEALAMSSALQRATASTHRILNAHGVNSSMHSTGKQLEQLWRPICEKLPCDPTNMHDVFVASHKQSMALFETGAVGHLHLEIRQRVKLDARLQHFVAEHHSEEVHFFHEGLLESSVEAAQSYALRGRKAVMEVILPFMEDMTNTDPERALRLVDHVEFAKYAHVLEQKETSQKHQRLKLDNGHLRIEDVGDMSDQDEDDLEDDPERVQLAGATAAKVRAEQGRSLLSLTLNETGNDVSPHSCVGKTVALWNHAHQHYMRMSDHRVERGAHGWRDWDDMPYSWTWERFVCVDIGNGEIAFHNTQWNRFLRLNNHGKVDRSSECSRDFLPSHWHWERFKLKDMGNGHFALWSTAWNKFVKMDHHSAITSVARSGINDIPSGWTWEKFYIQEVAPASTMSFWFCARTVVLWNHAWGKYVRMDKQKNIEKKDSSWKDPFPSGWEWERWVPIMAGHGEVAFHSTKWNRFLQMNDNGKMAASGERNIQDLVEWMTWERFRVVQLEGGKIALYNTKHKRFMKMDGGNDLVTQGPMNYWDLPAHWSWERFDIKEVGEASHCNFWCKLASPFVKVFKAVVSFVAKLLECFGQFAITASGGYGRPINTNVAVNFGVSGGVSVQKSLENILSGKPPQASIALSAAAAAGATTQWFWTGVGISLSVSCAAADTFGCKFGISVGAILKGWGQKQQDEKCPFGPTLTAFKCARSVGTTMLIFCCTYDLLTDVRREKQRGDECFFGFPVEGVLWEASEAGFAVADTDLGTLYAEGQFGVQQDYTLANYHLERGAEGGDSRAHFQLGVFKLRGKNGFPMDKKAAARHFRIAGEAGCRPALRNLSRMFATGDGIPQDSRMAVQCLVRAAEKSDTMQELLEKMRSGTLDRDTADKLQEHMERMRQKLAADPDFNPTADFGGM